MNDRELLELAAKAAGMLVKKNTVAVDSDDHLIGIKVRATEREKYHTWNPLDDDGDALRLAVKLNLGIRWSVYDYCDTTAVSVGGDWDEAPEAVQEFFYTHDPLAATRRAIVLAAAEIGRNIK